MTLKSHISIKSEQEPKTLNGLKNSCASSSLSQDVGLIDGVEWGIRLGLLEQRPHVSKQKSETIFKWVSPSIKFTLKSHIDAISWQLFIFGSSSFSINIAAICSLSTHPVGDRVGLQEGWIVGVTVGIEDVGRNVGTTEGWSVGTQEHIKKSEHYKRWVLK